ncbi:MAG: hypothetical protein ACLSAP_12155, partial [Oscillospiraceae bacterium]
LLRIFIASKKFSSIAFSSSLHVSPVVLTYRAKRCILYQYARADAIHAVHRTLLFLCILPVSTFTVNRLRPNAVFRAGKSREEKSKFPS